MYSCNLLPSFLLNLLLTLKLRAEQTENECIILNRAYPEYFLYDIYLYKPLFSSTPRSYSDKLSHLDGLIEVGHWILRPVSNKSTNRYFIQNKYHDKFLFVKKNYFDNLLTSHDASLGYFQNDEHFMWELERHASGWYAIRNVAFKEGLINFRTKNNLKLNSKLI
jgi:hypothetical protein